MRRSLFNLVIVTTMSLGMILPAMAQTYNGHQLQGRVTYVPVGTNIDAVLTSAIDSAVAKPGDMFNARLAAPLFLGNDLVLPANTNLEGQVTGADKAGRIGVNGIMGMRLTGAVTPDGVRYPLSATLTANQPGVIADKQGNLHGRTKSSSIKSGALRTAAWTAGGVLAGICFAPIVAGSVATGAVVGVATGGALGIGSNLWRKGKEVKVPSGIKLQFALDQPMSLSANLPGNNNYIR